MKKIVAIHQPNFFPWLGYFDKIARSDAFIFLDDVQFPKKGGVWTNRVKLMISGEPNWVTAAIDRKYSGTRKINEMHFQENNPWKDKMLKSLEFNYRSHPYYSQTMVVLKPLIQNTESNVAEYNIYAVNKIAQQIGLDHQKFKRSSDILAEGSSNELLCSLTKLVGGNTYLCGGGAEGYQIDDIFETNGLKLKYQNFKHPIYYQKGQSDFIPGLSIVDVAMNMGWDWIKKLMYQIP